jgi:hypothetical protein
MVIMAISKEGRQFETRMDERTEAAMRVIMDMEYRGMLHIPPEIIPKGYVYAWATSHVLGEPRPARIMNMRTKGWDIVPVDRHPELSLVGLPGADSRTAGHVDRTGLVLMERLEVLHKAELAQMDKRNHNNLASMPGTEEFVLPTRIQNQYSTSQSLKDASFG